MENGQLNWIANFIWGIADDENLCDKYAVSSRQLENARAETLGTLD